MKKAGQRYEPKRKTSFLKRAARILGYSFGGLLVVAAGIYIAALWQEDNHISKIARQFKCVCEMSCSMVLASCRCNKPGGGIESKNYIRSLLKTGLSDNEVASLYSEKYPGRRIL